MTSDLTMTGLAPYYGRPAQVPASRLGIDVYCYSGRPASGICECVWCYLGYLSESVRGCLVVCLLGLVVRFESFHSLDIEIPHIQFNLI